MEVTQYVFNHQLGAAIGIGCRQWMVFCYGQSLGVAINCGGRAEHQGIGTHGLHGPQQTECAHQVVVIVGQGFLYRLSNRLESCKMNHGRARMAAQGVLQRRLITDVAHHQGNAATGDFFDPPQRLCAAVGQVIKGKYTVARLDQCNTSVRANVAGASGDQDVHKSLLPLGDKCTIALRHKDATQKDVGHNAKRPHETT